MAQRIAGIAFLKVDSEQVRVRGNFTVSPSMFERTMLAGQDSVHGYQELPRVPYIEADLSLMRETSLDALMAQVDVTVTAELANGWQYTLHNAVCKGGFEANTRDGQTHVRREGLNCEEIKL
jgi:hypothetical protein